MLPTLSSPAHFAAARRRPRAALLALLALLGLAALAALSAPPAGAHIVPPEKLHPVAESYRRLGFLLRLNPVPWAEAERDAARIADALAEVAPEEGEALREATFAVVEPVASGGPVPREQRLEAAGRLLELSTRAVARTLNLRIRAAGLALDDYSRAARELEAARQVWAAFEPAVRLADPEAFRTIGECWLEMSSALGSPGVLGVGRVEPDREAFAGDAGEIAGYVETRFGERFRVSRSAGLEPLGGGGALAPAMLPPASNLNKQLPRPRQVLNMAERGVDESETVLIALGDMAFDSREIFGEPARSLGLTCNTCHNKGVTNPGFFIPGLSARPGTMDVSNAFFAPHANNALYDPLDIPDLRGIRFTAPYGRNGRFDSLREFVRNVIVNEFNGPEPDPLVLDAMVAYMLEFDFLPNPALAPDGRLAAGAPEPARRGEEIFHRPFAGLGGRSCATCHVPSDHFLDRRRHDIGSVPGAAPGSRDRALDTPTLLGARFTAPYFHDGSLPTLESVVEWFDERFALGLQAGEAADLVAYLETVGDGVEAYEDTVHTLEAEMEEFGFFLSTWEFLASRERLDLAALAFATVAFEIRAHKWDVRDPGYLGVLDRLAELMDEARGAAAAGDAATAGERVAEYRDLYRENAAVLK